jgi:DeoR family ulaG and ulaABCDEF operon transcriptional repressor
VIDLDRPRQIAEILRERPFASVRDLQKALGVSAATIRRDIHKLHESGEALKVYGGISAREGTARAKAVSARTYDENRDIAVRAKRAIARSAEALVRDGDSIIVHGGSTCFYLGMRLAQRNVRIYTNSMPLAAHLGERGTCQLVIAGGDLHREPGIMAGTPQPGYFASKFFLGTQGISAGGLHESHPLLVRVIKDLAACSDDLVVLADSGKFSLRPRNVVLPLSRIGTLVTDANLSDADEKMLKDEGVSVIIAPLMGDEP